MDDVKPGAGRATRRDRARATRLRMAKAAYALFCERGFAGTTMADIAAAAGVAVQTVYFTYHTKGAILSSAYELAVLGEDNPLPPALQPWHQAAERSADAREAIGWLVAGVGEIIRRATPLDIVVHASAASDPDAAAVWAHHERLRLDGYRDMVAMLATKAPLRDGLDLEQATHLLLMYLGPGVYRALVLDYGWTHEAWAAWVARAIEEQLFRVD